MTILALALLGQVAPCPPGTVCPPPAIATATNAPQWVWITNQGRYGWGTINAAGYFIEQALPAAPPVTATPEPVPTPAPAPKVGELKIGGLPNYGVDLVAMHEAAKQSSSFTTNDPAFRPPAVEQQVPLPTPDDRRSATPRPFLLLSGGLTGLLGVLGLLEWRHRHHHVDH